MGPGRLGPGTGAANPPRHAPPATRGRTRSPSPLGTPAAQPARDAAAWPGLGAGEPLPARTEDALLAFLEGFRGVQVPITPEEIHQQLAAHARLLEALIAWLNNQTA